MKEIDIKIKRLHLLLDEKLEILKQVLNITENQELLFSQTSGEEQREFLNISLEEKQRLIKNLIKIDDEFIMIFNSFNGGLNGVKDDFKESIALMQSKIKNITDIDVKVRIKEEQNKVLMLSSNPANKIDTLKVSKNYILNKYKENSKN